jgi:hypothetical protein
MSIDLERRSEKIGARIFLKDEDSSQEATTEFHFDWTRQDQGRSPLVLGRPSNLSRGPRPYVMQRIEAAINMTRSPKGYLNACRLQLESTVQIVSIKCGSRKAVVISSLCSMIANIYDSYVQRPNTD